MYIIIYIYSYIYIIIYIIIYIHTVYNHTVYNHIHLEITLLQQAHIFEVIFYGYIHKRYWHLEKYCPSYMKTIFTSTSWPLFRWRVTSSEVSACRKHWGLSQVRGSSKNTWLFFYQSDFNQPIGYSLVI